MTKNKSFSELVPCLLILILGVTVFSNALSNTSFHYDDDLTIMNNPAMQAGLDIPFLWRTFNTRFLTGLTFYLNKTLTGVDARGFRVVNVLLHLFNGVLVFFLFREIFRTLKEPNEDQKRAYPCVAALLFIVHPLQSEAVNFINQRYVLLAGFFYILALLLYMKSRRSGSRSQFWGAWLATISAMFCKETAFTLPLMIGAIEICFMSRPKINLRQKFKRLLPFLLTLLIIPATLQNVSATTVATSRIATVTYEDAYQPQAIKRTVDITRAPSPFSRQEYAATQLKVLVTYLRLSFVPVNLNADYDYPLSADFKDPLTLLSGIFLLSLVMLAVGLRQRAPLFTLGVFWFFLTLSVESSIIPIAHVIAEYRMYLAILGVILAVLGVMRFLPFPPQLLIVALLIVTGIFSFSTYQRNEVWRTRQTLWEDTVRKSPLKTRPLINLGKIYTSQRRFAQAENLFLRAINLEPHNFKALTNMGVLYVRMGRPRDALPYHLRAVSLAPPVALYTLNLGAAYAALGQYRNEVKVYEGYLFFKPDDVEVMISLAEAFMDSGNEQKVEDQIRRLKELGHTDLAAQLAQERNSHK